MTLAVCAIVELFVLLIAKVRSYDRSRPFQSLMIMEPVGIYGRYPALDGKEINYHRHPIRKFDFTELDGKERWTAYRLPKIMMICWRHLMSRGYARPSTSYRQIWILMTPQYRQQDYRRTCRVTI